MSKIIDQIFWDNQIGKTIPDSWGRGSINLDFDVGTAIHWDMHDYACSYLYSRLKAITL